MAERAKPKVANGPPLPTPTTAKAAQRSPGGSAGKREGFNLGKTWLNPETNKQEILPPLIDYVASVYEQRLRFEIVQDCQLRYQCSPATVDRAIAKIKAGYEEAAREIRASRLARFTARLDGIYRRGMRKDDLQAARGAVMDQAKLLGLLVVKPEEAPSDHAEEMSDAQLAQIAAIADKRSKPAAGGGRAVKKAKRKKGAR